MSSAEHRKTRRKIMLVDDHPILRNGLAALIDHERDLAVCGQLGSAAEVVDALDSCRPDLIVADISMSGPNGLDLTKSLRDRLPDVPVLILSMHDEDMYAERALRAGAKGYVMKQESPETVLAAIRRVLRGDVWVSERVCSRLLSNLGRPAKDEPERVGVRQLSDRELEVFEKIGRGLTTRQIAEKLHISIKTVESHRANIKLKLKLQNATELSHRAIQWVETDNCAP